MFDRWGRFVHRFLWPTLPASLLLLTGSLLILKAVPMQTPSSSSSPVAQSAQADNVPQQMPASAPTIDFAFSSSSLQTTDPMFRAAMQQTLAPLQSDSRVTSIATPYTTSGAVSASMTSTNRYETLAVVSVADTQKTAQANYASQWPTRC
jgi:hypothetical protein